MLEKPEPALPGDIDELAEHCADFAVWHGVDCLLDTLASIHRVFAPMAQDPSYAQAYAEAGIPLDTETVHRRAH